MSPPCRKPDFFRHCCPRPRAERSDHHAGPKGNQNAAKASAETATSFLYVRVRPEDKRVWTLAAQHSAMIELRRACLVSRL